MPDPGGARYLRLPPRPCTYPGCAALVSSGSRCEQHRAKPWATTTTSSTARGYGARWRRQRAAQLMRHPYCESCGAVATEVDHIVPLADGGASSPLNLRSLCTRCHASRTGRQQARRLSSSLGARG